MCYLKWIEFLTDTKIANPTASLHTNIPWLIHIFSPLHYSDVIMSAMMSQITSLTIAYSTIYSGADQRNHQSSASLAFVRGIHRRLVDSPHKGTVTRKMFPFVDVIMVNFMGNLIGSGQNCMFLIWVFNIHYDWSYSVTRSPGESNPLIEVADWSVHGWHLGMSSLCIVKKAFLTCIQTGWHSWQPIRRLVKNGRPLVASPAENRVSITKHWASTIFIFIRCIFYLCLLGSMSCFSCRWVSTWWGRSTTTRCLLSCGWPG